MWVAQEYVEAHIDSMKPNQPLTEKLNEAGGPAERGYEAWKRAKIKTGLEQAKDRDAMIPVSRILVEFDFQI